jgi:hypothetical protein
MNDQAKSPGHGLATGYARHGHGHFSHEEQEERGTSSRSIEQDRKVPAMALQQVTHAMATGVAPISGSRKGSANSFRRFFLGVGRWVLGVGCLLGVELRPPGQLTKIEISPFLAYGKLAPAKSPMAVSAGTSPDTWPQSTR